MEFNSRSVSMGGRADVSGNPSLIQTLKWDGIRSDIIATPAAYRKRYLVWD